MLKTRIDGEVRLVEQPDHARVSGYLAAHWGGGPFCKPGYFPGSSVGEKWRDEFVLAVVQHDNGWWEWEAFPQFDELDGFPLHLTDLIRQHPEVSFERWRRGILRLADAHPWAALLVLRHAYWLYAVPLKRGDETERDLFRHPLFGGQSVATMTVDSALAQQFLGELTANEAELLDQLQRRPDFRWADQTDSTKAHVRLLQLFDAISLILCFNETQARTFTNIPERSWQVRVDIHCQCVGSGEYSLTPFPFDQDPLFVHLPIRIAAGRSLAGHFGPMARLHSLPVVEKVFRLRSSG